VSYVVVSGLSKKYRGQTVAVDHVSFDVNDREAVFLLGPSGAGKTTTLRLIAGLEDPDGGNIEIGGQNVNHTAPGQRNVAMVYDKHSLFPHLTVFENLAYPLRLRRISKRAMTDRIMSVAKTLQIEQLVQRMPAQLSGGQMQRVAIGRALVRDADVYLMDEPISHLDAKLRAHMRVEFKRLQKEFNATILYVSHDQLEAMTMSDRVVVIDKGRIQQIGSPQEIFDRPASQFVGTFIGEPAMNVLAVTLAAEGNRYFLDYGKGRLPVEERWLRQNGIGSSGPGSFTLGVRPHHLRMAKPDDPDDGLNVEGVIYALELLGSRLLIDIAVGGNIIRVIESSGNPHRVDWRMGAQAGFRVDADHLYLFDNQSGRTVAQAVAAVGNANSSRDLKAYGKSPFSTGGRG
jgi:ABC-type sugar transport system ATPase subunit